MKTCQRFITTFLAMAFVLGMTACSKEEAESFNLVYKGKNSPIEITAENAVDVVTGAMNGRNAGGVDQVLGVAMVDSHSAGGILVTQSIATTVVKIDAFWNSQDELLSAATQSAAGSCGGTVQVSSTQSGASIQFENFCDSGTFNTSGLTFDGAMVLTETLSGIHLSFTNFYAKGNVQGQTVDMVMSGSMTIAASEDNVFTLSLSFVAQDNLSGEQTKTENFVISAEEGNITLDGRIYIGSMGYVDVETVTAISLDLGAGVPDAGEVRFVGADNVVALITLDSDGSYSITLDGQILETGSWSDLDVSI